MAEFLSVLSFTFLADLKRGARFYLGGYRGSLQRCDSSCCFPLVALYSPPGLMRGKGLRKTPVRFFAPPFLLRPYPRPSFFLSDGIRERGRISTIVAFNWLCSNCASTSPSLPMPLLPSATLVECGFLGTPSQQNLCPLCSRSSPYTRPSSTPQWDCFPPPFPQIIRLHEERPPSQGRFSYFPAWGLRGSFCFVLRIR